MKKLEIYLDPTQKEVNRRGGDCDCACATLAPSQDKDVEIQFDRKYTSAGTIHLPLSDDYHVLLRGESDSNIVVVNGRVANLLDHLEIPTNVVDLYKDSFFDISQAEYFDAIKLLVSSRIVAGSDTGVLNPKSTTLTTWLHITNSCNLQCPYCFVDKSSASMSFETAKASIEKVFEAAIQNDFSEVRIKFAGGEPTLSLKTVVFAQKYASEKAEAYGIDFSSVLLTNGTFINDDLIEFLLAEKCEIMISLDGLGQYQNVHRSDITGKGTFEIVFKNINALLSKGIVPFISVTLTDENYKGLPQLADSLSDLSLPFTVNLFRDNAFASGISPVQSFTPDIIKTMKEVFKILGAKKSTYNFNSLLDLTNLSFSHVKACGMGESYIVLDHQGQVHKCHMDLTSPMTSVYSSEDLVSVIIADSDGPVNLPVQEKPICNQCDWKFWCAGGCPLSNQQREKQSSLPSPNCKIYKSLLPELLMLEGKRILKIYGNNVLVD